MIYDHQSGSVWMHLTGECFAGKHAGTTLKRLSTGRHTTWADWVGTYPGTRVLARNPRYMSVEPDAGYFPREGARSGLSYLPRQFESTIQTRDGRMAAHDLCYGVVVDGRARAYPFAALRTNPVVEETLGAVEVTVWFDAPSRSAAAFRRRHEGRLLTFERSGSGGVTDTQTGSRWTLEGRCTGGPLKGAGLEPVFGLMCEWYGWSAHHPQTTVWAP